MTSALSSQVALARAEEIRTLERTVNVRRRSRRFRRAAPTAVARRAVQRHRVA